LTVDRTVLQERLVSIVRRFPQRRILVVGDAIADQFVYGGISRVSREAPVFIIRHEHTETVPGGAANCAANLAALGAKVSLVSIAGEDEAGRALVEKLRTADVNCDGVITPGAVRTTTKVRILAGQSHSTRQQVVRIDYEGEPPIDPDWIHELRDFVMEQSKDKDAIIISDYNYGVITPELIGFIGDVAAHRKIPVLVDSRFRLMSFSGFTSATPNEAEVEQLLAGQGSSLEDLTSAGEQLRKRLGYRALLITRGGHGMMLLEEGVAPLNLEAIGSHEPVDVTGAGDTVIATYTLALSSDASFPDAARLANYAGGLVVMKRGTASITSEELENSVMHSDAV
jgi:D-glycero-beta-D-manno-heptose-7-phosphate kinase